MPHVCSYLQLAAAWSGVAFQRFQKLQTAEYKAVGDSILSF